ncbi:MAG: ADP-ribosylglycohydrolase family protein [Candidatus Obscuribacterales bacterium]|nr:ADP-ribosylglycohydrolase family protein [Steroidobacteraceae bacterium]
MNQSANASQQPSKPFPNSYWVEPGHFLAGEYPGGASLAITTERIQALLAVGITLFVDLTAEHELKPYDKLFDYVTQDRPIRYLRESIKDHGIPQSMAQMQRVVAAITEHLAAAGKVYLHCRAGIGRTGTTVACFLVQNGLDADAALDRLNELWRECDRSRTWPSVPETDEQIEFVRRWSKFLNDDQNQIALQVGSTAPTALDRYLGALLGLAIGDALGGTLGGGEPQSRSAITDLMAGGPLNLPRGAWLADTAMTLCLAQSLFDMGRNDPEDQMQRYLAWQRDGVNSSTGVALDVPNEVRRALAQWQWSRKPIAGSHDPMNRDGHPLARTTAVALYYATDATLAIHEAGESARTTSQAPIVLDACRAYAAVLLSALQGEANKDVLMSYKETKPAQVLRQRRLKPEVMAVIDGDSYIHTLPNIARAAGDEARMSASSDVLDLLNTALWAFDRSDQFAAGALLAVNASPSPASAGAVYGALAGAYYGVGAIPMAWRKAVCSAAELSELAQRYATR